MQTELLIAIISAVATIIAGCLTCYTTIRKEIAVLQTEMKNLTAEVKKHNGVIERTYNLEKDMAVVKNEVKSYGANR